MNILRFFLFFLSFEPLGRHDLPPENESSFMLDWKLRKGAKNGEEILHTGADYQGNMSSVTPIPFSFKIVAGVVK